MSTERERSFGGVVVRGDDVLVITPAGRPQISTLPKGGPQSDERPEATAQFPPPLGALTWRKRSHGISATQMYDLTQHPRLPSVIGCGF